MYVSCMFYVDWEFGGRKNIRVGMVKNVCFMHVLC